MAARARSRGCRSGRCKYKMNSRLRFLRDLSRSFYPGRNIIDVRLKSINDRKDGNFGTYDEEASIGSDIPKIGKVLDFFEYVYSLRTNFKL